GFALGRIAYPGCKIRLHESELAEKAAGVEHAGGVEFLLEALADYAHCSRDRVKHRHLGRAFITVQHGVASVSRSLTANSVGVVGACNPAQAPVPFDEGVAQTQRRRGGWHRHTPQRTALEP